MANKNQMVLIFSALFSHGTDIGSIILFHTVNIKRYVEPVAGLEGSGHFPLSHDLTREFVTGKVGRLNIDSIDGPVKMPRDLCPKGS